VVIGGGPAGATAAAELAARGHEVVLFAPPDVRPKPCGGGIPPAHLDGLPAALAELPFREVSQVRLTADLEEMVDVLCPRPLRIYERRTFDEALRGWAAAAGAEVLPRRVEAVAPEGGGWRVRARGGRAVRAEVLVVADGASGRFARRFRKATGPETFYRSVTAYIPRRAEGIELHFFRDILGYLWVFPRRDHLAVGIACRVGHPGERAITRRLISFLRLELRYFDVPPLHRALIPCLPAERWPEWRCSGDNWLLAGDAAMFANPLTGEGISFALRSGRLVAEAIDRGDPGSYEGAWRETFGRQLACGAAQCRHFEDPVFPRMMIAAARLAPGIGAVLTELLTEGGFESRVRDRIRPHLPALVLGLLRRGELSLGGEMTLYLVRLLGMLG
jgi:geranylgeranyl reductase family protein